MGDFVRLLVDLKLQLARVARVLTTRPSFTKRLALVLKAVSGLVEPASPTYLTERMLVSPCVCLPVRKPAGAGHGLATVFVRMCSCVQRCSCARSPRTPFPTALGVVKIFRVYCATSPTGLHQHHSPKAHVGRLRRRGDNGPPARLRRHGVCRSLCV